MENNLADVNRFMGGFTESSKALFPVETVKATDATEAFGRTTEPIAKSQAAFHGHR